jgi:hypothetical protein
MKTPTLLVPGALALVLLTGTVARAGDPGRAEALFQQGRKLMEQRDFRAACPKLAESYGEDPATGSLLALAYCQEQLGQSASAWASYSVVLTRAKSEGREDRAQAARERMDALEPTLSHLTIVVDGRMSAVPGLVVTRDGAAVGQAAWGYATSVDPGEHVVEARAPGKVPWRSTVAVGASADAKTVAVPPLADLVTERPASFAATPAVDGSTRDLGTAAKRGAALETSGMIVGGAGFAVLGLSAYFGMHSVALRNDAGCGSADNLNCASPGAAEKSRDAVDAARNATITLVAGSVLTATGIALFVVGKRKSAEGAAVQAAPAVGRDTASLIVRGTF